ncbi:MAG: hypothetical protein QOG35_629 [Solirubrobacteraceae bacterium]|jgi:hypothetical protein|nr:hypothetical protein [Solirubrobacteraceae bacterium]
MPAKTQREREAEQRKAKLDRIQEQVDDGSLVIRQMTEEERTRFTNGREESEEGGSQRRSRRRRTRSGSRPLPPLPRT